MQTLLFYSGIESSVRIFKCVRYWKPPKHVTTPSNWFIALPCRSHPSTPQIKAHGGANLSLQQSADHQVASVLDMRLSQSRANTCQHAWGDFRSKMYCVKGDGSSSYLSKGSLSITIGSQSTQENLTTGWAVRGGWEGSKQRSSAASNQHCFWGQIWDISTCQGGHFEDPTSPSGIPF